MNEADVTREDMDRNYVTTIINGAESRWYAPMDGAYMTAARVLTAGREKHGDKWKERDEKYYIDHAVAHLMTILYHEDFNMDPGDEDHLGHALTDLVLAVELRRRENA